MAVSTTTGQALSASEAQRRLRVGITAAIESGRDLSRSMIIEIGTRTDPVHAATEQEARDLNKAVQQLDREGGPDDLEDFIGIGEYRGFADQIKTVGYVAHIYFTSTGTWGQLEDTRTVWISPCGSKAVDISGY